VDQFADHAGDYSVAGIAAVKIDTSAPSVPVDNYSCSVDHMAVESRMNLLRPGVRLLARDVRVAMSLRAPSRLPTTLFK
jgi:hypothetical protein